MLSSVPVSTPWSEDGHINDFGRLQQAEQRVQHLSNPEHEERQITNAKVNEEIAIVGHIASKVLSHDHMPNPALRGVQLTLDVFCDILLHRIQRHALDVNSLHQSTPSSPVLRSPSAGPPPSPRTCTPPSWLKCREQNTSPSQIPCFLGRTKKCGSSPVFWNPPLADGALDNLPAVGEQASFYRDWGRRNRASSERGHISAFSDFLSV